ncbi:MAG: hypothetical protein OXT67_06660 [Zetaproteobacteria bacterium]|nr:hypothetical protein [Zetaproteobacteria bacterium]
MGCHEIHLGQSMWADGYILRKSLAGVEARVTRGVGRGLRQEWYGE